MAVGGNRPTFGSHFSTLLEHLSKFSSKKTMDVKASWAAEEAKTVEERRRGRNPAQVCDLEPWPVHFSKLAKYQAVHSIKTPEVVRLPALLYHGTFGSGNAFFYVSRSTPAHVEQDKKNDAALAAFKKALPREDGSVRISIHSYYLFRRLSLA